MEDCENTQEGCLTQPETGQGRLPEGGDACTGCCFLNKSLLFNALVLEEELGARGSSY